MRVLRTIVVASVLLSSVALHAARWLLVIEEEQHLRRAEGIVLFRGVPIRNAEVTIFKRGTQEVMGRAVGGADGHFRVRHLASGAYDMQIDANGMNPMLWHIKVDGHGSKTPLNIEMPIGG